MLRNKRARVAYAEEDSVKRSQSLELHSEGEVRARLEDFSRYFDSVGSELGEAKAALEEREKEKQGLLTTIKNLEASEINAYKAVNTLKVENEKTHNDLEDLRALVKEIEAKNLGLFQDSKQLRARIVELDKVCKASIEELKLAGNRERELELHIEALHRDHQTEIETLATNHRSQLDIITDRAAAADEELTHAIQTITTTKNQFADCITLEENANCIPLTSGQLISFEGLIRIWLFNDQFNGNIWFPFSCPLTKKTTTPVADLSEILTHFYYVSNK